MACKIPLESITISGCSLNTKCLYLAHEDQGKPGLWRGHCSPSPAGRGFHFFSVAFRACLGLLSWFSVSSSAWTDGAAEVAVMLCQFIPTEGWALYFAKRDWLFHALHFRMRLPFLWYLVQIMGSLLLSGRAVFVACCKQQLGFGFLVGLPSFFSVNVVLLSPVSPVIISFLTIIFCFMF